MLLPGLAALLATPALADPAMWKVSDADSAIYLFGSMHIFTRDVNWRTPEFDALLKDAQHVYFEVVLDVEAYSTITYLTITDGMFRDGQSLDALLTDDEWDRLAAAAEKLGLNAATFRPMKPWLVSLTLGNAALPKASAGVEMLVDGEIAPERKRSLETAAEQMGFFIDTPLDEQVDGLMSLVEGIETDAITQLEPLVTAWEQGDTAALLSAFDAQVTERDRAGYDRLITTRNHNWVGPLEELLKSNDESLVIVGAAHLIGDDGVPTLLEQAGYTVERIDVPPAIAPLPGPARIDPRKRR
jgi:uncharacterized protein YbaP (TraB family)